MAKASKDRRAVVEQMRREQQRAEKKRTAAIIAGASLVALVIIGAGAYPLVMDGRNKSELERTDLAALGVSADAAGCTDPVAEKAEGNNDHREPGSVLEYSSSPPAAGPHYPDWAPMNRKFYTAEDRPPLGQLVHNLEHGYNILWYDETIAQDEEKLKVVEDIAGKFPGTEFENKFIAAPWTAEDGDPFPEGSVALTHWSMGGTHGNPEGQHGITQYCAEPSGEAVASFVEDYPFTDSPEPGAS